MYKLAALAIPLLALVSPASSADLDRPVYRGRNVVIERPAPRPIVGRERIIERYYYAPPRTYYYASPSVYYTSPAYYYAPAPVYRERVVVEQPRAYYVPRVYTEGFLGREDFGYGFGGRPVSGPYWYGYSQWPYSYQYGYTQWLD